VILKNTTQTLENAWSVVLDPLKGEMAKNKAARLLEEIFSVSEEDALQLIENAPIILLDDLPQDEADRLKASLQERGLDTWVTNAAMEKRKCFKTVWPADPKLDGLLHTNDEMAARGDEVLPPNEAIAFIREELGSEEVKAMPTARVPEYGESVRMESLRRENALLAEEKVLMDKKLDTVESEIKFLKSKADTLSEEVSSLGTENDHLRHELEAKRISAELLQREKEINQELIGKLQQVEESSESYRARLETLEKEYAEAETVWVQKVQAKEDELNQVKHEAEEAKTQARDLDAKLKEAENSFKVRLRDEMLAVYEQALKDLVKQQDQLESEIKTKEFGLKAVLGDQERLEKEIVRLKQHKDQSNGG